ncbi:hypothetical protein A1359_08500 [Methylomonas lenta]|uniref:Uncharacterized protein n=1 Tax=Methylomonas lenta TaxID=980561 RepID=A0A177NGP6_9GAMM|nr:hypothetical protein [Methylomonas lenta]OAI16369.1 hypothetical protein A1359_08500 [Methylomonas lenta]
MNYQSPDYHLAADEFDHPHQFKPKRLRRWLVFLLVFLPCLFGSQIYIFLQPAIYQSVATVLTMAATDIDQASPEADLQHVSIQKQVLLGSVIMEKTAERLQQLPSNLKTWSADELRSLLAVTPEPDTNLVQLQAQGPEPKLLQLAVNAWIESYLQIRAAFIAENTAKVTEELNNELQRIAQQVQDKRNEIDQFRLSHDILSTESADNQAHARLQGLNKSLNDAMEEEVKTKAKFDAILDAISRNETVIPESDSRSMAVLIQQAEKLRDQLAAIEAQYTKEYIDLNPSLSRVREQLAEIEAKISEKSSTGKNVARQEAENNYNAARQAVIALKQQMQAHKKLAADYTSQFTEHQALQKELENLETLQQDTQQRLVEIDVKQREKYPQVDVVDWASLADKPISPNYLQESLLAFAISLALALLAVLIIDYLNRESPPSAPAPLSFGGIHLHHQPQSMLDALNQQPQRVAYDPLKALPVEETPREMPRQEVLALYQSAEPVIKAIISLLFNGLSLMEIRTITPDCLNTNTLMILIPGQRNLIMTASVAHLCASGYVFSDWPSEDDIKALLCCAAIDSGLSHPEQITLETLQFTYLLFLLQQGIKLADLSKIVGPLPPSRLLELSQWATTQASVSFDKISLDYLNAS